MRIEPFAVEEWMNEYEEGAKFNTAETCVDSISIDDLLGLAGKSREEFFSSLCSRRLTYGDIQGSNALRSGIASLYRTIGKEEVVTTHGAAGGNHHVFISLVSPGDHVVSVMPTYQQLYSIPRSITSDVDVLKLRKENGYLPDLDELKRLALPDTRMIAINNPNNPTGAVMDRDMLCRIIEIADKCGAYLLCDEVYRHLGQDDEWCESVADLYDKGISVGSMSKVFSLAGIRIGWIATHDEDARKQFLSHRDYDLISCGMIDDVIASLALENKEKILERNRGIIRSNLAILDDWIHGNSHFSYVKPQAGTTALIHYDFQVPSYKLCKDLYTETGAFLTPGDCFEEPYSFRIGYACNKDVLEGGLKAISEYCSRL